MKAFEDALIALQAQKPHGVSVDEWQQAIRDGAAFIKKFGVEAAALGWEPNALFAVPNEDSPGGLIWKLRSREFRHYDWQD